MIYYISNRIQTACFCANHFVVNFVYEKLGTQSKKYDLLKAYAHTTMYLEHLIFGFGHWKSIHFFLHFSFAYTLKFLYRNRFIIILLYTHILCIVHTIWFWMLSEWRLVIANASTRAHISEGVNWWKHIQKKAIVARSNSQQRWMAQTSKTIIC